MKSKLILVLVLVALLLTGLYFSLKLRKQTFRDSVAGNGQGKTINVVANAGKFEPNVIELQNFETVTLSISAVDRDYVFVLEEFNINSRVPKGKVTKVEVEAVAVGPHPYSCGEGCSGEVIVSPDIDIDYE